MMSIFRLRLTVWCRLGEFTQSEKDLPCKPEDVSSNSRAHIKERKKAGWPDTGVVLVISALERQTDRWPVSPDKPCKYQASEQNPRNWLFDLYTHAMPMYPHKHTKL